MQKIELTQLYRVLLILQPPLFQIGHSKIYSVALYISPVYTAVGPVSLTAHAASAIMIQALPDGCPKGLYLTDAGMVLGRVSTASRGGWEPGERSQGVWF